MRYWMKNKYLGSIFGLAVGDALGAPVEFKARDSFPPVKMMIEGGPFNLKAGQWTDDTSLALCMAISLIEKKHFDPSDIMSRFYEWYKNGYLSCTGHCFDIGNTTKKSILRFEETKDPYGGLASDFPANGSLMRLAPIPLFFYSHANDVLHYAELSSKLTHASPLAIDCCRALAFLITSALNAKSRDDFFSYKKGDLNCSSLVEAILLGSYKNKERAQIISNGEAINTLEAAMWAFYETDNFNDGVLLAVNLGDDADTVGAVYGQLAGAFYGIESIRQDFLDKIYNDTLLENVALDLYKLK